MNEAQSLQPPNYTVIFTNELGENTQGYSEMANKLLELAYLQEGFLGVESARDKIGITVSYWRDLESIKKWKNNIDHKIARKLGKEKWYNSYTTRIAKVEREYSFNKNNHKI